jgi:hypothetical protein
LPRCHVAIVYVATVCDTRIAHLRGSAIALFFACGRLRIDAGVRKTRGICFPSKHYAAGFVFIWLETVEALLEHRVGRELTATLTGRWLRILAVLRDASL